ncbi:putative F-box-like domain superfamily protein [Arabidopsis thaliana]
MMFAYLPPDLESEILSRVPATFLKNCKLLANDGKLYLEIRYSSRRTWVKQQRM